MEEIFEIFIGDIPKYISTTLYTLITITILLLYCRFRLIIVCNSLLKQHNYILSRTYSLKLCREKFSTYIPVIDKSEFLVRLIKYCQILPLSPVDMHNLYYLNLHLKSYNLCKDSMFSYCVDEDKKDYSLPHAHAVAILGYCKILSTLNPYTKNYYNKSIRENIHSFEDFVAKEINPLASSNKK